MRRAFVLIRSDPGAKGEILEALEEIPEVREAPQIHGIYDIIAQVEAETMPELKEVVIQRIKLLDTRARLENRFIFFLWVLYIAAFLFLVNSESL